MRYDVLIAGYGPVGQTAAALLAQAGHSVATFERHEHPYPYARAGCSDHEVMRSFQPNLRMRTRSLRYQTSSSSRRFIGTGTLAR